MKLQENLISSLLAVTMERRNGIDNQSYLYIFGFKNY